MDDQLNDKFLKELFGNASMESPGRDFVSRVMAGIPTSPVVEPAKRPFYLELRAWWPYALAALFIIVFLMTSDIPFSRFIPGTGYFSQTLLPQLYSFFTGIREIFGGSGSVSILLIVLFSGLFLLLVDRFLFKRFSTTHLFSF